MLKLVSLRQQQKTWNDLKQPVKVIGWHFDSHIIIVLLCLVYLYSSQTPNLQPCILSYQLTKEPDDSD